jgi:NADH-quinone oxidoreductase subunit E
MTEERVSEIVAKYQGDAGSVIAVLQDVQEEFHYLPSPALRRISREMAVPLSRILSLATFYRAFSLKPRGRHIVTVCQGTACHVRGGPKILEEFQRKLGLKSGDTTKDNMFTLETVACLGCCAIGPVVVVDGEYHAQTTIGKVETILKQYARR